MQSSPSQSTTMTFQSVTFGTDNHTVISTDHDHLNRGVQNPNALSDTQKASVNIAIRDGTLSTWNSHGGDTTVAPKVTSVQLQSPTGLVKVPGMNHEVTPEVLEKMKETSPELFIEPEAKAAQKVEAADAAADAAAEEAKRAEINRFVDDAAEGVAMHIANEVSLSGQETLLCEVDS